MAAKNSKKAGKKPTYAKAMTKSELKAALAEATDLAAKEVQAVLEALTEMATSQVKKTGVFTIPGLVKLTKVHKPAQPARRGINPFTKQEQQFAAKPAKNVVKVRALKNLKDAVA